MKKIYIMLFTFIIILSGITTLAYAVPINNFGTPSSDPALTGGTVIDFESEALTSFTSRAFGDVTISTNGSGTGSIWTGVAGLYNSTGDRNLHNGTQGFQTLIFDFTGTVSAFGFHFGGSNEDWSLQAYDSVAGLIETYILPQTWYDNDGQYFGISASGIASASLTQLTHLVGLAADGIILDDFTYVAVAESAAQSVPEPATMTLLGIGLVGLIGASARRRFKNKRIEHQ